MGFEITTYFPNVGKKTPVTLKLVRANCYLSCNDHGELALENTATVGALPEIINSTKRFLFLMSSSPFMFESAVTAGKFICTTTQSPSPVSLSSVDNSKIFSFVIATAVTGSLNIALLGDRIAVQTSDKIFESFPEDNFLLPDTYERFTDKGEPTESLFVGRLAGKWKRDSFLRL
uniref:Interleukin-1 beta n=1 Tax=Pyxicephalus adspersus TaxID=30357 RepID=A0AAV3AL41_PYXAD|nr:TPA: hypothetical protein GDO54_007906 [Pyxicephalus adspersus]